MLVTLSRLLILLIIVQCVRSLDVYKSNRTPLKYKEIRRTSSFKIKEEKIYNKSIEIVVDKNSEQDKQSVDNLVTFEDNKSFIVTSTIKPKRRTLKIRTFKSNEENTDSNASRTLANTNKDQDDKPSIDNIQTSKDKKPRVTITAIKPKRRPLNAQTFKEKNDNESTEIVVDKNSEQDKQSIDNLEIFEDNKSFIVTSTIKPKRRTLKIRTFKTNEGNTDSNASGTLSNINKDQDDKPSIDNIQTSENKKPSATTTAIKPKRRPLNTQILKKEDDTGDSGKPTDTLVNNKSEQNKASNTNVGTAPEKTNSGAIKQRRVLNPRSRNKNDRNTDNKSVGTLVSKISDASKLSSVDIQTQKDSEVTLPSTTTTTLKPRRRNFNAATPVLGNKRIVNTEREVVAQTKESDAATDDNISKTSVSNNSEYEISTEITSQTEASGSKVPEPYENEYQSTTPYAQLDKITTERDTYVPIIGSQNYVYAYNGDYHYSYESGDGTKAFESGELKSADGRSNASGVVGGYSYKDKDGKDISLSYTAGEGGYQPVGAHLPTPPPIPPAIQRALRILATKTTPEPVTESIDTDY